MIRTRVQARYRIAVEQVNGALLRLIKNYAGDFSAIAQEAGTPPDSGLNLAGVELDGFHYMLMKVGAAALCPLTDRQREIPPSLRSAAGLSLGGKSCQLTHIDYERAGTHHTKMGSAATTCFSPTVIVDLTGRTSITTYAGVGCTCRVRLRVARDDFRLAP